MPSAGTDSTADGLVLRSTRGRMALTATVVASAMTSLDATVVNVALPHIGKDLHVGVRALQGILTGYLLALASLILLGGALGDRFGRRKIFLIGMVWFAVASALCAGAPNIEVLIGARVLEGVGGALLTPGSLAMLQASFRRADRAAAVGAWSGLGGVAGAIGAFVWRMLHTDDPLVPPALFRSRVFTVVNLATFLLYGALGVTFFLVAYELQVGVGWSALQAGVALLPATVLLLLLSRPSGSLAQRIGPRPQLVIGPLLAAAGLLLLTHVGPHASWVTDVLPGGIVFGLGLVTFVAPLTATVMAAADADDVSVASGVNNAVARAASLAALAVVPVVAGLSRAVGPARVTHAFRLGLVVTAALAAGAAAVAAIGLDSKVRVRPTARRVHCAVDGMPLQPDPRRCPVSTGAASA